MSVPTMAVTVELGAAVPNTSAAVPSLKNGNSNFANTPPATGTITVSEAPAGVAVTSTGRTQMATQAFLSGMSGIS